MPANSPTSTLFWKAQLVLVIALEVGAPGQTGGTNPSSIPGSNTPAAQTNKAGDSTRDTGNFGQVVVCPFSPEDLSHSAILLFTSS